MMLLKERRKSDEREKADRQEKVTRKYQSEFQTSPAR